jgi:hypothetical protein
MSATYLYINTHIPRHQIHVCACCNSCVQRVRVLPQGLHTFGFRGEALSSLAALGELSVITRTAGQAAATRLDFDRDGHLTGSTPVARAVGTTVAVKDLFVALPVRRQVWDVFRDGHYTLVAWVADLQSGSSTRTLKRWLAEP